MHNQFKCIGLLFLFVHPIVHGVELLHQLEITVKHNSYRSNVNPPAADMLSMSWYKPAAVEAQWWADKCDRLNSDTFEDKVYGKCSKNTLVAPGKMTWLDVVKAWGRGSANFTYGGPNNAELVGNYVKMIFAPSQKIGCGSQKCSDSNGTFNIYVCNYCPGGNIQTILNTPYKNGSWCSSCTGSCKIDGLCNPK